LLKTQNWHDNCIVFNVRYWTANLKGVDMYQVTAIFEGCEIGYGEGEGSSYAIEECIESIDSIYQQEKLIIVLHVLSNTNINNIPLGYTYKNGNHVYIVKKVSTNRQIA
jgi:hypothetical protein